MFTSALNRRPGRARGLGRFHAAVETLEGRSLLTGSGATILLSGGMIQVLGTDLGDTGSVSLSSGAVHVKVANSHGSDDVAFAASQVNSFFYLAGSGANNFTNGTSLTGYLYGGSGDNTLTGGSGADYLIATGGGNEVLNAGSGNEVLEALGSGHNVLNGGSGVSTLVAVAGDNTLVGGSGTTSIVTYGGRNTIAGGSGSTYVYSFVAGDVIAPVTSNREAVYHIGY